MPAMTRTLSGALALTIGLLALPAAAPAMTVAAPQPPNAAVLRALGLKVGWPVRGSTATVPGGRQLVVDVARVPGRHGRRPSVRVSLVRLDGRGVPMYAVARSTLKSGTFTAQVPRRAGRYVLWLHVAGRHYGTSITAGCPTDGQSAAALHLEPAAGRPDERFNVRIVNTGETCLSAGYGEQWERQLADGSWQPITPLHPIPVPAVAFNVMPGASFTHQTSVWPELTPGTYRVVKSVTGETGSGTITLTAPFTVLP
jgi:Big-like domain-containing protein